ncbi:lytic transglycosylase domain-containing protein [Porphyrobacter algicida]|uniref:Lytic transglycosylase domain-containing protein n=1 Tax=Qipengyuania algicida TaxID=1836209 RepID=A0A845ABL2_9SPHN|nr:lytic transglycosylase domain-containing protein [Qipengyuania algicida]MXP27630.1 lytic transglycosylase domain-containing protein [Qipengyuania algicida]
MPNVAAVSSADNVLSTIARASGRTGTNFDFMVAQARVESALDPKAKAGTSSAAGLYQFTNQTWLETVRRHGAEHGLGWASEAIGTKGGKAHISDPTLRQQVMDLRFDPQAAAVMAGALSNDNAAYLQSATGRAPDNTELYLAHFLGAPGAGRFINALAGDPNQSAAALFPEAAAANRSIFYDGNGARSLSSVRSLLEAKLADGGMDLPQRQGFAVAAASDQPAFESPQSFASANRPAASALQPMSEILASTFGHAETGNSRAARHVAAAYSKLAEFGL